MLKRLLKPPGAAAQPLDYEESKHLARSAEVAARGALASRQGTRPEILYYLAEDASPEVRRGVAANPATPPQADVMLARDEDDEVRCDLARKIARLVPELDEGERLKLRELTIEILEILAQDQLPRVRQILAEELKHSSGAPRHVIQRLARDIELVVAAPILEYSPLLSDADLLEIIESDPVQGALNAISRRQGVGTSVADAIVESYDEAAVAGLLANPSAQIREETLDRIIDRAPDVEPWHEPLARWPELSVRAMRRIAGFVASSLVNVLIEEHELDEATAAELTRAVRRRLNEDDEAGAGDGGERARRAFEEGTLDDELICRELDEGGRDFVKQGLALKAELPLSVVARILGSGSAKAVTALAWRAGLGMRTAMRLQSGLARIPPREMINARDGVDYPLAPDEMDWQLEYFAG
ncbi:MAG: DUF2336 domain-containing protein [Alphaproteobacteria bacterium]